VVQPIGFEDDMAIQEDMWYSLGWHDLGSGDRSGDRSGDGSGDLMRGWLTRVVWERNKWARK